MHEERDVLIKHDFPQLRKLCDARGVSVTEVDLQWSITQEQAQRGEVLPICLAEMERDRPFLGRDTAGWPKSFPQSWSNNSYLAEYHGKSVTELETIHGVLPHPAMANRDAQGAYQDLAISRNDIR